MRPILVLFGLLVATPALAQQRACPDDYTVKTLRGQMDTVDQAIAQFDLDYARSVANDARAEMRCLKTIVDPSDITRIARQLGLLAFFDQDEAGASRWGLLAKQADAGLPWPESVGKDHPFRVLLDDVDRPIPGGPEGKGLIPPKKGAIFMSGEILFEPVAPAEVPQLMQHIDNKQQVLETYWQDGAAFRDEILSDEPGPYKAPKWYTPPGGETVADKGKPDKGKPDKPDKGKPDKPDKPDKTDRGKKPKDDDVEDIDRGSKKKVKVPNLVIGVSLAAVAGGLYGLAYATKQGIKNKDTDDKKASARTMANALVLTSAGVGAAAVGVTISALVGETNGIQIQVRW